VGACAAALRPLHALIEAHVLAADRLHGDDTTVPILAKGQTETGRVWVYVRDDRPFGGKDPPAALFYASRDRTPEHPERHLSSRNAKSRRLGHRSRTNSRRVAHGARAEIDRLEQIVALGRTVLAMPSDDGSFMVAEKIGSDMPVLADRFETYSSRRQLLRVS
jgi:hypothetical protein